MEADTTCVLCARNFPTVRGRVRHQRYCVRVLQENMHTSKKCTDCNFHALNEEAIELHTAAYHPTEIHNTIGDGGDDRMEVDSATEEYESYSAGTCTDVDEEEEKEPAAHMVLFPNRPQFNLDGPHCRYFTSPGIQEEEERAGDREDQGETGGSRIDRAEILFDTICSKW